MGMQLPTTEDFLKQPQWVQDALNHIQGWIKLARPEQLPPLDFCTNDGDKNKWLLLGGRGGGKTRPACETLYWWAITEPNTRWCATTSTNSDLRNVIFGGESGLLSVIPDSSFLGGSKEKGYNKSEHTIKLMNGSIISGFSAESPERIRGNNFHGCLGDEVSAWNDGKTMPAMMDTGEDRALYTWNMLKLAVRLGEQTRFIIATTPRPTELFKEIYHDPSVSITKFTTFANRNNLSPSFLQDILKYEGTRLGRQEIYAELLEDVEGGIFERKDFLLWAAKNPLPAFDYVIQSYDTAFTEKTINDRTACTTWGMFVHPKRGSCAMLLDCWAEHISYPDLREKSVEEFERCVFGEFDKEVDLILVEEKGSGISLIQDLQKEGLPVMAYNPGSKSKFERANLVSYLPVHGKIYIPEGKDAESGKGSQKPTSWANEMLTELCQFTGKQRSRDDYVDSSAQAWKFLLEQGFFAGEHKDDDEDDETEHNSPKQNPYAA